MVDKIVSGIQVRLGSSKAHIASDSNAAVCQAVADRLVTEVIPMFVQQEVMLLSINVNKRASIINFHVSGRFVDFAVQNLQSPNLLFGHIDHMQHETVLTWFSAIPQAAVHHQTWQAMFVMIHTSHLH